MNKRRKTPQQEFEQSILEWTTRVILLGIAGWVLGYSILRLLGKIIALNN